MKRTDVGTSEYISPQQTSILIPTKDILSICLSVWHVEGNLTSFPLTMQNLKDGGMVDISILCIWAKVTSRLIDPQVSTRGIGFRGVHLPEEYI
jgi:hypothetical protein